MRQDPVPGSTTRARIATSYPDLPLRLEYLGLVQTNAGKTVLDLLKDGDSLNPSEFEPTIDDTHRGKVRYLDAPIDGAAKTRCQSRSPSDPKDDHHQGPLDDVASKFRSTSSHWSWRTYYIYERCTRRTATVGDAVVGPRVQTRTSV